MFLQYKSQDLCSSINFGVSEEIWEDALWYCGDVLCCYSNSSGILLSLHTTTLYT